VDSDEVLTQAGTVIGTPAYMAPEQAIGRTTEIGPATDVWALGVILYELLTGRRPFTGENGETVKMKILTEAPPPPRSVRPDLSRDLEAVVLKCLEKKPDQRYPAAAALAEDLERFQDSQPLSLRPVPRFRRRTLIALAPLGAAALAAAAYTVYRQVSDPTKDSEKNQPAPSLTLVPDIGKPGRFRFLFIEKKASVVDSSADRPFSCRADGFCFIELLARAPASRFLLQAEMLLEGKPGDRAGGLYFAHTSYPAEKGEHHCYWLQSSTEPGGGIFRRLRVGRFQDQIPFLRHSSGVTVRSSYLSEDRGGVAGRWRKLAVEVTAEQVKGIWDGETLASESFSQVQERTIDVFKATRLPNVAFQPQGGLGLFLADAEASFRNVRLTPLS
jgi:hypothetical protein